MKNKGKKRGNPGKYKPKYCQMIIDHFDVPYTKELIVESKTLKNGETVNKTEIVANDLPWLFDFARSVKVSEDTIVNWTKQHKEFLGAYKVAKKMQERMYATNSMRGLYNPMFAIFAGKNIFGWTDRVEQQVTGKDGKPLELKLVTYKEGKK